MNERLKEEPIEGCRVEKKTEYKSEEREEKGEVRNVSESKRE